MAVLLFLGRFVEAASADGAKLIQGQLQDELFIFGLAVLLERTGKFGKLQFHKILSRGIESIGANCADPRWRCVVFASTVL
jgi:hypothetical protein